MLVSSLSVPSVLHLQDRPPKMVSGMLKCENELSGYYAHIWWASTLVFDIVRRHAQYIRCPIMKWFQKFGFEALRTLLTDGCIKNYQYVTHHECQRAFVTQISRIADVSLMYSWSLQFRLNERDGVSDHQPHHCLLNRLFSRKSKKTSKLRVTGFCSGNSPLIGEFPTQRASNVENVSISWRQNIIHVGLASISLIILGLLPYILPRRQVNDCFYFGNVILKNGKLIRDSIMLTFSKVLSIIFCK